MRYGSDILNDDSITDSANKLVNARAKDMMIIMCCNCSVVYNGSVESNIDKAVRTVILKPDNTLLVHSSTDYKPINWQKSSSEIIVDVKDDSLIIKAIDGSDELIVTCYEVYKSIHYKPPEDDSKTIIGTEEDMHNSIIEKPSLIENGLSNLEHEKEISVGSIDIFAYDKNDTPVIIEVKRRKAQLKHVDQLHRYVEGYKDEFGITPRGILVAPTISNSAQNAIQQKSYEFCKLEPLSII